MLILWLKNMEIYSSVMKTVPGAASLESFAVIAILEGQAAPSSLQFTWRAAHSFSGRAWLEEAPFSHEWKVVLAAPKLGIATPVSSSGPSRNSQGQPVALATESWESRDTWSCWCCHLYSTFWFRLGWCWVLVDYKEPKSEVLLSFLFSWNSFAYFIHM